MCWSELAALSVLLYGGPFLPGKVKKNLNKMLVMTEIKMLKKKKKFYLVSLNVQSSKVGL